MTHVPLDRLRSWRRDEAPAFWFLGTLVSITASSAETGGAFTLIEQLAPAGFGPPLHIHHREDELFHVVEGRVRFRCGDRDCLLEVGGSILLPREVAHAFRVEGPGPARLLQFTAPGGFDRLVADIGVPAPTRALPPPAPPPPDLPQRLAALGAKHHFSIVGPPL